ncbi:zinc finger CCHC domain-containing protein 8 isoform X2 [Microcaecilia unicolor]|uniref:Zinc finger CCHC domain-containing protein 8 n=1 Tax=Microcaecilia unicolor TaxID=1415580 RepID=A0A6P7Z225_9AMPH|nr:zinc finger CCHC domain-containing protein 8 isoform X2 [Microcaecilia unicolor]
MAGVDFGDSELFEQLDDTTIIPQPVHVRFKQEEEEEEAVGSTEELVEKLRQCEETILLLKAENQELRRKLNILTRPSGLSVDNSRLDGPLLEILFLNNDISKQYRQEVEDFVSYLVKKYEEQKNSDPEKTSFNVKPQPSSIMMEEDDKVKTSITMKKIKDAFSVVGSVLYFTNFCLDKLGQPLLNENPNLTDGWEIPKYQQVFTQIVALEGQDILQVKTKRPKANCFNCGSEEHQLRDCPQPRDLVRISGKRKEFMELCGEAGNQNYQQRYHAEEVEERFGRFKPGIISEELQDALGLSENNLPPFIYRMRQLGYPPGWLKEAELENSGLALYDGDEKDTSDGELEAEESGGKARCVTYDISKLVNYPGFNISAPRGIADDWRLFGSIPMQSCHQKDVFAHYLTSNFPSPKVSNKRNSSSQSSPFNVKKQKMTGNSTIDPPIDMDIDSAYEKGRLVSQTTAMDSVMDNEDTFTLEELEEQQRLIWAALEQAESTNSDSDMPADTPLTGNSVASSPGRTELDNIQAGRMCAIKQGVTEPGAPDTCVHTPSNELPKSNPSKSENTLICINDEEALSSNVNLKGTEDNDTIVSHSLETNGQNGDPSEIATVAASSPQNSDIPDMSKFAVGITPFEYDNMAESTGVYLRLRSLLKNSPRNMQKGKKSF